MLVSQVTLLQEYLERNAAKYAAKTALVFKQERLTWGEVNEAADRLANCLRAAGVERGDRVVIYLDNGVQSAVSIFGVLKAGAVFSVVNSQTKSDKLLYMLNDCRAKALITSKYLSRTYAEVLPDAPHLKVAFIAESETDIAHVRVMEYQAALAAASSLPLPVRSITVDLAAIIYTSGSTGDPKGVMLTHQNMVAAAESITTYVRNVHDDVVVNVLPMSFDYGLYQWLMVNQFGGTLVLDSSFNYPAAVLKVIAEEQVTGLPVVPTIASLLAQFAQTGTTLPGVRYVTNTAAALSPTHIEVLKKVCPNARIYSMYGLTECKRVCYLPPEDLDRKPDSVGRAMPNMETFVLDPETQQEMPRGEVGELVVRGPQVMKGYWEKPEVTANWLKPGKIPGESWLWTGDFFKMDEEGYLYFVSRKDDIIKSRGEKVSPKEVENALYALAGVQDAAVIGTPDPVFGEAIRAFLVLSPGVSYTKQQVISHCGARLEGFMVPKYVTFLTEMQKTTSGKITKKDLVGYAREHFSAGDEV
ncbi:MAG: AMP-binding protein [Polyangiaceae bacterium]|nr:AMP-binding protein [Polyangiaceae bacterium]